MIGKLFRIVLGTAAGAALALVLVPNFLPSNASKLPPSNAEDFWEYDAILGWKNRSGMRSVFTSQAGTIQIPITINNSGLRDRETPYIKPAGTKRILLLGDSYPAGFEVNIEDHIKSHLERLFAPQKIEVISTGVRGYGTDQSLLFLSTEGFRYQPDIVIYFFTGNDPEDNIVYHRSYRRYGKGAYILRDSELTLTGIPVPLRFDPPNVWKTTSPAADEFFTRRSQIEELQRKSKETVTVKSVIKNLTQAVVGKEEDSEPPPPTILDYEWKITTEILRKMAALSREASVPILVYEVHTGHVAPQKETRLERAVADAGLSLIVSRFKFTEVSGVSRDLCFPNDLHWNAKGHKLAAQIIHTYLVERKLF